MSWYNSGNWTNIENKKLQRIKYELNVALLQRMDAICVSYSYSSTSYSGGSTTGKYSFWNTNITSFRNTLEEFITDPDDIYDGVFVNNSDGSLIDTVEKMITLGGYGNSWVSVGRADSIRPWLQIRNILEGLKYLKTDIYLGTRGSTRYGGAEWDDGYATWADCVAAAWNMYKSASFGTALTNSWFQYVYASGNNYWHEPYFYQWGNKVWFNCYIDPATIVGVKLSPWSYASKYPTIGWLDPVTWCDNAGHEFTSSVATPFYVTDASTFQVWHPTYTADDFTFEDISAGLKRGYLTVQTTWERDNSYPSTMPVSGLTYETNGTSNRNLIWTNSFGGTTYDWMENYFWSDLSSSLTYG